MILKQNVIERMFKLNYFTWSQEYYTTAVELKRTIEKYEKALKEGKVQNLELINSIIANYKNIYYDVLNTGKLLESRGVELEQKNAA